MQAPRKTSPWLVILTLIGLGIAVSPHRILTRTVEVSRALSPVLSSYEVIRMEPGEIEQQVRTTGELRFRFQETDFYFNLEPHDMRAPNYRAVETGPGGVRRTLPSQPAHTFKGVLAGRKDTVGRFNLTDGGVEGVVYAPEGWYYLEPLRNYLPSAPAGDLVVFRHADIKPGEALKCSVSLPERLEGGVDRLTAQAETAASMPPTNYVFDVATEADYEYVQALGGAEKANREIEGILNLVEGAYQSELLLQLRISFQNAWETEDDPYTATNSLDLMDQFADYWNTHYADTENYDIAHLWTDRERDDRAIAGRAWLGVACRFRDYSYGMSTRQTELPVKYVTPTHEIGHNFGAVHPDELVPPVEVCDNTLMTSGVWGGSNRQLTFCQFSRQQIAEHVAGNNSCLDAQEITLLPPTGLTARATSESSISLAWQDSSTNETGFVVQRRREGSGDWIQIGATAADVTTLSSSGLFSSATYIFRVQAFNDEESSAYSNEAEATTLAGKPAFSDWIIDTVAGRRDEDDDNGPAVQARLGFPNDVAADRSGNVYITDWDSHRVRRVDANGTITTVAGTGEGGFGGDGGPAGAALLWRPIGVAVDSAGNLYISDQGNHRIRRVDRSGIITTVAGNGKGDYGGDGGPAVDAGLYDPRAVAVDGAGNLYIAQTTAGRIRRVDTAGIITTVATGLRFPRGLAVDGSGNLYIADSVNDRIRRVDAQGVVTTVAGTGVGGFGGDGGPAVQARLHFPYGLAVDSAGNLYIADLGNHRIRRVDGSGIITTVAGIGTGGFDGDGGPALGAQLNGPRGLAVDGSDNLYIADLGNHRIRRVDGSGSINTIAGIGKSSFSGDGGPAVGAHLYEPAGVAVDGAGNLYIADTRNNRIRRVDTSGIISTIAGNGHRGYSGDGGPAPGAELSSPGGVAVDNAGNLYIADTYNHRVRRVNPQGVITTITTQVHSPGDVDVDGAGNLYVADTQHNRILRVDESGSSTTIAGTGKGGYGGDGGPAVAAQLWLPEGVAVDGAGNIYIADRLNHRIRRVDGSGIITTFAGGAEGEDTSGSGPAVEATLRRPVGVAVDKTGNVYIADVLTNVIRRVDGAGIMTTIAGTGNRGTSGDGGPALEAQFHWPRGLAVDSSGNVYVADSKNHRIRVLTRSSSFPSPTGLTATAVSFQEIIVSWQDNSTGETGFSVQRRVGSSTRWVEIGTTAANATSFSDTGLEPVTTYHYRVRAFKPIGFSGFSNEAMATTAGLAPTVSGFAPTGGPVRTRVTVTGTRFLGATEVSFNGVTASEFEIMSTTRLRAVVPAEATSGPIRVVTPHGTGVSGDSFTVTEAGFLNRLFVPVVLRLGGAADSFYTSELTLTNRDSRQAAIGYSYTASIGSGSGTAVDSLGPGQQRIVPDAIAYLASLGMSIGRGGAGGTLQVDFSGLSSATEGAVTVRTGTPVPGGRAGLTYPGLNGTRLLDGPAWVTGLRQNNQDRSNLALQNAGKQGITLRVTVFSGDPAAPGSRVLPEISLGPGEFHQYNAILARAGFRQGYAKVEKTGGISPYYAYGVINDQVNSDGSFVFPVTEDALIGKTGQTLPVIVETEFFHSELTVTNFSPSTRTVHFSFVADAIRASNSTARFSLRLQAGEQRIIPKLVRQLRQEGLAGIGPPGPVIAGAVFATVDTGDMSGIVIGARTGSPGGGGQFGVFYHAVPYGAASVGNAWIHGLQQNSENRSNLALVNTGEVDGSPSDFSIDIHDGDTGQLVRTVNELTVPARGWRQVNRILAQYAPGTRQGYLQVRQTSGNNPFIAYGVINDGAAPGQRSGDGAFLPSQE